MLFVYIIDIKISLQSNPTVREVLEGLASHDNQSIQEKARETLVLY